MEDKTVKRKFREMVKLLDRPVTASIEDLGKIYSIAPVEEIDHVHVCVPTENFEARSYDDLKRYLKNREYGLLFHLYDNSQTADYEIDHPRGTERNIIIWYNKDGTYSLKVLPIPEWDIEDKKKRTAVKSDELGLTEVVYVDIVRPGMKVEKDDVRVKKHGYDMLYSPLYRKKDKR